MGEAKKYSLGEVESMVAEAEATPAVQIGDDFHGWLLDQASALRDQRYHSLDFEHLAEELEAMAAAERRELLRRLTTLFAHLLKLQYQPQAVARRGRGWRVTVARTRTEIKRILAQSPGLTGQLGQFATDAYAAARRHARVDLGLERHEWERKFPSACPWTLEQLTDEDFFPS